MTSSFNSKANDTEFGLDMKTCHAIRSVFAATPGIDKVVIYGSRAKGNYRKGSDIDLVLIAPSLNTRDLLAVENRLDDLMLPYKIDLSLFHHILYHTYVRLIPQS